MVKAKKKYGQNFLKSAAALSQIIEAMPHNTNKIVEIGPGLGDLTKLLVKRKDVLAYEVDSDLYSILKSEFSHEIENGRLKILLGDVLAHWESNGTLHETKYDLIANLPYYIATNIILRAFDDANCENIIVMVQKEVAQKFTASPTQSDFGALSVIASLISIESRILFDLPPSAFVPPPKVDSSVIFIKKKSDSKLDQDFNKFLKAAFIQPRKVLIKNLSSFFPKEQLECIFGELNISKTTRPHELDASLYSLIYERIYKDDRTKLTKYTSNNEC